MSIERLEQLLLLHDAGELSTAEAQELETLTGTADPATRERVEANARLLDVARTAMPGAAAEPSVDTLARIRAAARQPAAGERPPLQFPTVFRRILAYAAVLAIVVGGFRLMDQGSGAQRILEVSAMVAATDVSLPADGDMLETEQADLNALASQLLEMQGLSLDDDGDMLLEAVLTPRAARPPTTLRLRNTSASPARKYG